MTTKTSILPSSRVWRRCAAVVGAFALVLALPSSAPITRAGEDSLVIDGGALLTASSSVAASITPGDGSAPAQVRLANDGSTAGGELVDGQTIPWAASIPWSLDAAPCPCADGELTVWAQWRTADGPWSAVVSDSITVDRTGPTGTVVINGGDPTIGDPWNWVNHGYTLPMAHLSMSVTDAGPNLPPRAWAVSRDGSTWEQYPLAAYGPYEVDYDLLGSNDAEGVRTVWVKWEDAAGNWSAPATDTIVLKYQEAGRVVVGDGGGYEDTLVVPVRFPVDVMPPEGVKSVWVSSDYLGCDMPPYDCSAKEYAWTPGMVISWDLRNTAYLGSTRLGYRRVVAWFVSTTGRTTEVALQGFILDKTPAVSGPPRPVFATNSVVADTSTTSHVTASIRWTAAGTGSPVAASRLQRSASGGAWKPVTLATKAATSATVSLAQKAAYRFRSRALDKAGNWSTWTTGATFTVAARQQNASSIVYTGRWHTVTRADASGRSLVTATAKGARATTTFTGRSVAVVAPRSPNGGEFDVFVDGRFVKTVYLYGSAYQPRRVVFATSWASAATHRISIVKKYAETSAPISLDAILVLR